MKIAHTILEVRVWTGMFAIAVCLLCQDVDHGQISKIGTHEQTAYGVHLVSSIEWDTGWKNFYLGAFATVDFVDLGTVSMAAEDLPWLDLTDREEFGEIDLSGPMYGMGLMVAWRPGWGG